MERLLDEIERDIEFTSYITKIHHLDQCVIEAIRNTPREKFTKKEDENLAYLNLPLGIGYDQTISQPFVVAIMTHLLEPRTSDVVLEIGTGSGYQAAVLSKIVKKVYSVEIIPELFEQAQKNLKNTQIKNVKVFCSNGYDGLPSYAPFDKIIFTACAKFLPPKLVEQLKIGGIIVGPIWHDNNGSQMLVKAIKQGDDKLTIKNILPVRFVPFVDS